MKKNWLTFKGDGRVTKTEFVTLWQSITHGNQETAEAFFYLADLNDDNIIDSKDLSPLYNVFDTDGKHKKILTNQIVWHPKSILFIDID